jgi:hypothetical protein
VQPWIEAVLEHQWPQVLQLQVRIATRVGGRHPILLVARTRVLDATGYVAECPRHPTEGTERH